MKKILAIVLVLTFLLVLAGCDPAYSTLDRKELLANTVKVELFEYENESPELIDFSGKDKPHFDFENATLIAALDEACFEDLINELTGGEYLIFRTALNEPKGKTLVLHQSDGNMYVLYGCTYKDKIGITRYAGDCYLFDANGKLVDYIGRTSHLFGEEITSKYFSNNP
jgi:hypothetical protein